MKSGKTCTLAFTVFRSSHMKVYLICMFVCSDRKLTTKRTINLLYKSQLITSIVLINFSQAYQLTALTFYGNVMCTYFGAFFQR